MKKKLIYFLFSLTIIIFSFLTFTKRVSAQNCDEGWKCECPIPSNKSCANGTCVAKRGKGQCEDGEVQSWVEDENICTDQEKCSLTGRHRDFGNRQALIKYECCCGSDSPSTECECEWTDSGTAAGKCVPTQSLSDGTKTFYQPDTCTADKFIDHPDVEDITDYEGIKTALGCIPVRPQLFVFWLLNRAISIGAGIAFLIMIWGGFQVMTSSGDPEKLQEGKNILVSAGAGLLFIIFSTFILELIGINILKIPGWGG